MKNVVVIAILLSACTVDKEINTQTCHVDAAEFQNGLAFGSECVVHVVTTLTCFTGATAITVDVTDGIDQFWGLATHCNETVEFEFAVTCGPVVTSVWFDNSNNQDICSTTDVQLNPCPALDSSSFTAYAPDGHYLWSTYGSGTKCIELGK